MLSSNKLSFIRAYFSEFQKKISRLEELYANSFKEEALILCIVYIDQLASGRYYGGRENSKENFCRALRELSGNDFFSTIHPKVLLNETAGRNREIQSTVESIVQKHPSQFLAPDAVNLHIEASSLPDGTKSYLIANLWRASVAAICYEKIRCQAIHGPGRSVDLSFSKSTYNGQAAIAISFDLLYRSLQAIFHEVESISLQTGEWFGDPQYR